MTAMTDFMENKFIDWFFRGQAIGITGATAAAGTGPANLYYGLFTSAPTDSSGGTEVSGGSYTRVGVASSAANMAATDAAGSTANPSAGNTGSTSNNAAITFPAMPAATVTHFGAFDALSGGHLLFFGPLTTPKVLGAGETPSFAIGAFTFQIDN